MDTRQDGGAAVADPAAAEAAIPVQGNFPLAVAAAALAALLGAVIWATVAYTTGYSIGYMALLIGIIVGYAVRRAGNGSGRAYQILGAGMAALGWALGTWLSDLAFIAHADGVPFASVLPQIGVVRSIALAVRAAEAMDVLFLLIAIYEGYKFSGDRKKAA